MTLVLRNVHSRSSNADMLHFVQKQNIRTVSKGTQTPRQSRVLVETTQLSSRQSQPMTTESQPIYTQSDESQQPHHTRRLFPAYVWYLTALFLYKTRNFVKRRNQREFDYTDESFFRKSGLDSSLEYGYGLEYEDPDDFLSVTSNYGSTSRWTPDSLDKFDLELELTDSQI